MAGISTLGIGANLDLNVQMDQIEAMGVVALTH